MGKNHSDLQTAQKDESAECDVPQKQKEGVVGKAPLFAPKMCTLEWVCAFSWFDHFPIIALCATSRVTQICVPQREQRLTQECLKVGCPLYTTFACLEGFDECKRGRQRESR